MRNKCKNKLIIIILGIFLVICGSYLSFNAHLINNNKTIDVYRPQTSAHWSLNFVYIYNNWSATAATYAWCSGDGSWSNPYTIENVTINASGSPTGSGIYVVNSRTDYFVIRNCTTFNSGTATVDAGIRLENTTNGMLVDNICSNNGRDGIKLHNTCENNTVSGNTAETNDNHGIFLWVDCNYNTISGNTANSNDYHGIRLDNNCDNNTITGNTASYNLADGIWLRIDADYNYISGNTATYNVDAGIYLYSACYNNIITKNIVSNNEFGVYLYTNCGNNTISGNIGIDNGHSAVIFYGNCDYNIISNNTASNGGVHGLRLRNFCDQNIVSGNIVSNVAIAGLLIRDRSNDNTVTGNIFNDNGENGILVREGSDMNIITNNAIYYSNTYGVETEANCDNNLFYLNSFIGSAIYNIWDLGNNQWDNGTIGNYWDDYSGYDLLPIDGIGDTPHSLPLDKYDTRPIMALGWNSDGDAFLDSEEASYGTNALDDSWYPMPNLEALYLSSVTAYNKTSFGIDFSISNNGIWKAEGVVIVLECVELALTLFDNSLSPFVLDVDETKFLTIYGGPIGQEGDYTLSLTVDPSNTILETYSSKDGSLRGNAEDDNSQTATLTILSEEIEDPPEPYRPPPTDMTPMVISSIAGVIGLVAIVLVFTRTKSRAS